EDHLELPALLGPPEPRLHREGAYGRPLLVEEPGAARVVEERLAVVTEDDLLTESEGFDRRIVTVATPFPPAEQEGERDAVGVEVLGDLERHADGHVPHCSGRFTVTSRQPDAATRSQ